MRPFIILLFGFDLIDTVLNAVVPNRPSRMTRKDEFPTTSHIGK
jgi:hypothetical protein